MTVFGFATINRMLHTVREVQAWVDAFVTGFADAETANAFSGTATVPWREYAPARECPHTSLTAASRWRYGYDAGVDAWLDEFEQATA